MQRGIDVECMHTNFGGYGLSSFGDIAPFKNSQISLSVHGGQKIESAQKIHLSSVWWGAHVCFPKIGG